MKLVAVSPTNGGKQTAITLEFEPEEAELLLKAIAEGKLESLGIKNVFVEPPLASGNAKEWSALLDQTKAFSSRNSSDRKR
jgi:hypothetical protein